MLAKGFGGNTLKGIGTLHLNPATYGNAGGTQTSIPPSTVYALDPSDRTDPVTNNYSLSLSQQFSHNNIVQVSYVGNKSNSLLNNGTTQAVVLDNINALPVGALFTPTAAAKINALANGNNTCNVSGCTPQEISTLDTIYNYPGDKSIQTLGCIRVTTRFSYRAITTSPTTTPFRSSSSATLKAKLQHQLHLLKDARHLGFGCGLQLYRWHRPL